MPHALDVLRRIHRRLLIHRRGLVALCAAVAVWAVVVALRPPGPATTTVWTAARDLPSGTVLAGDDLRARQVPVGVAPPAARGLDVLRGRTLAAPMSTGEIATTTRLMGNDQLSGYPGRSALPLRIPDAATVGLLRPGDRVDLVGSDPQRPQHGTRITRDAIVLALPQESGTGHEGRLVVFAVPSEEAVAVASAASGLFLDLIWNR